MKKEKQRQEKAGDHHLLKKSIEELEINDTVRATATAIYRKIYEDNLYYGRSLESVVAGTIYLANRIDGNARNPSDFADFFDTDREEVLGTARYLTKRIDGLAPKPILPEQYIKEYTEKLSLDEKIEDKSKEIIQTYREHNKENSGKSPTGLAAGAIYCAVKITNESTTQEEISEIADVSTVTIRNVYKSQLDCYNSAKKDNKDESQA